MKQRGKTDLRYKALETILKCISAIVLCSFIGWFIADDANNKVMYATHEAKKIALQASWDKAVEDGKAAVEAQRAEEERLAAEEAARKAAEEAEAKRLQEEQEAKERAAQADGVAKENVVYGSKLGHVSVDGTNVSCSLYWETVIRSSVTEQDVMQKTAAFFREIMELYLSEVIPEPYFQTLALVKLAV